MITGVLPDIAQVNADARHRPIKCYQGNLGQEEVLSHEGEQRIDNCQEDQDAVLDLRRDPIYSCQGL